MPHGQCLSLGGKQLIKWQSSDLEVIVEDQHLKREVDDSVCELEISEVMEGGKAEKVAKFRLRGGRELKQLGRR